MIGRITIKSLVFLPLSTNQPGSTSKSPSLPLCSGAFTTAFFMGGGQQINLHIMDLKKLEDAIEHPENPEYRNLTVRVTGYCARFITLSREYQENFVARMNYSSMN
jgi:hypothetical protein